MFTAERYCVLSVVLISGLALLLDLGHLATRGIAAADAYYLPLRSIELSDAQRQQVEDSIVATTLDQSQASQTFWTLVHSLLFGLALSTIIVVRRSKSRSPA